ncbi:MAG: ABC transporter permease [Planctomycetota bacterium]|nr:ABC transporter permease [Planctomycetota bacterium]
MHRLLVEHRLLGLPRTAPPTIAWSSFVSLALLAVAIGALFSRITARRSATSPATLMGSKRQTSGRSQLQLRQALVVVEVAGALALVMVAALMMRSGARLASIDPGFRTENVVTFGVVFPAAGYGEPALRLQFVERALAKLRELPGVRAAASAGYAPMGAMRATRRFAPEDRPMAAPGSEALALDMPVGPGYFEVMGIPVVHGRPITERDFATAPPVLVVSETFAREVFGAQNPLGKRIGFYASRPGSPPPPSREIVGVVGDVRQDAVGTRPMAQMYSPYAQTAWGFTSFFVQVEGDTAATAAAVQRAVSSVDPMRPVRDVKTTADIVRASTARPRAMTWLLLALAVVALTLAAVGLYGVSATAASARAREFAIRAAVGANPSALVRLVLRQSLLASVIGVSLGAVASIGASRGVEAFLFETQPQDPVVFASTVVLLLTIALTASYLPARRALRTNPAEVLRAE